MPETGLTKARILVADDQEEWLSLIGTWLTSAGYCVIKASGGGQVLPLAEQKSPDAIVLDYDLGDRKGSEVCASLKARPEFKDVPVVILTNLAGSMLDTIVEGRPDHFVVKSQHPDELLLVLEGLLSR
ncbi:MAG: response regulator [Elusimicrobia bacterium]|nr:response regulator [Elusimicrobiota bacterium]